MARLGGSAVSGYDTDMRIFFTGGSGKAGKHVAPFLAEQGHQVTNADLTPLRHPQVTDLRVDLTDAGQVYSAMAGTPTTADLDGPAQGYPGSQGLWTRGLLVRRSLADGACAFFATWCPAGTNVKTLVQVEGSRWAIEDSFETAKTELGLDHNESRSWHGWHRHMSLVMLAFAMLATIRHHANQPAPQKTLRRLPPRPQPSSAGRSRKSAALPSASRNAASARLTSSPGRSGAGRTKPSPNAHI